MSRKQRVALRLILLLFVVMTGSAWAAENTPSASSTFDEANKLFEQSHFEQAAALYESLRESNPGNATLLFNLGNAHFRAGAYGQSIKAYRLAQRIAPRDPDIRFNLNFARKEITGSEIVPGSFWKKAITRLTVNEWTMLTVAALWIWFGLLAVREWRPSLKSALKGYTIGAGVLTAVLAICLASVIHYLVRTTEGVITVQEAVVRFGPLQESQVSYQLGNGSEVAIHDRKEVTSTGLPETWLQISDASGRKGWVRESQVDVIQ